MSGDSCAGKIGQCIRLVEEVQRCLGRERRSMNQVIDESRRTIGGKFRYEYDSQDALRQARIFAAAEWHIRAFDLISSCCEDIKAFVRRSKNGESSQNGVDVAVSNLVHLAQEFPNFRELRKLGKYLEEHCRDREGLEPEDFNNLLSTRSAGDSEIKEMAQKIAKEQTWNLASIMVYVKMIFDKHRTRFQTLLFISEVVSYGLNVTAENNIKILVPILVLSATCFLFINIPLIWRCCRKRTVRVVSQIEWVESSFSIFQLVADILKVAGHAKSSSKVTETWVLVLAVIGYVFFLIKRND